MSKSPGPFVKPISDEERLAQTMADKPGDYLTMDMLYRVFASAWTPKFSLVPELPEN